MSKEKLSRLRINSYFSLPTDLATEMSEWPEFISGEEYSVELRNNSTNEEVFVVLVEGSEDDLPYVHILANETGYLFERVVGRVIFALSAHTDNLMVMRWNPSPN
jgi:hypothetical protein